MEEVARVDGGERVSALCDDGKGALWAGAGKTLYRCDGQGGGLKKVFSGQGAVRDIVASPLGGGQVYVLTSQGIVCVEGESGFRKVAEGTDYEVADVAGDGKVYVGGLRETCMFMIRIAGISAWRKTRETGTEMP